MPPNMTGVSSFGVGATDPGSKDHAGKVFSVPVEIKVDNGSEIELKKKKMNLMGEVQNLVETGAGIEELKRFVKTNRKVLGFTVKYQTSKGRQHFIDSIMDVLDKGK